MGVTLVAAEAAVMALGALRRRAVEIAERFDDRFRCFEEVVHVHAVKADALVRGKGQVVRAQFVDELGELGVGPHP
jgi:hypothetical protein